MRDAYSSKSEQYVALVEDEWRTDDAEAVFVRSHLTGLSGPVLDLGCGPGHWTAWLHSLGVDVTGVDVVPAFVEHARTSRPGPAYRLGSMTDLDVPDHTVAGVLSWFSTIHLPPPELDGVLAGFRRLLGSGGVLVIGFFDSDDEVAPFDHQVITACRWPADVVAEHLQRAGFTEVERLQWQVPERPDRRYAAIAARAR